jgi:hypothetical protein
MVEDHILNNHYNYYLVRIYRNLQGIFGSGFDLNNFPHTMNTVKTIQEY